jgi:hypothetical protein
MLATDVAGYRPSKPHMFLTTLRSALRSDLKLKEAEPEYACRRFLHLRRRFRSVVYAAPRQPESACALTRPLRLHLRRGCCAALLIHSEPAAVRTNPNGAEKLCSQEVDQSPGKYVNHVVLLHEYC